jgi:hypothetical protein
MNQIITEKFDGTIRPEAALVIVAKETTFKLPICLLSCEEHCRKKTNKIILERVFQVQVEQNILQGSLVPGWQQPH